MTNQKEREGKKGCKHQEEGICEGCWDGWP